MPCNRRRDDEDAGADDGTEMNSEPFFEAKGSQKLRSLRGGFQESSFYSGKLSPYEPVISNGGIGPFSGRRSFTYQSYQARVR